MSAILAPLKRLPWQANAVLVAYGLWTLVPAFVLLSGHGIFNGGFGIDVADLMQYMGFIRESGQHLLIANPYDVVPERHLFLEPAFAVSGALWRLGASIQFSLLVWVPVTAAALMVGFLAYVRRMFGSDLLACAVTLLLALFYASPAMAVADWMHLSPTMQFGTKGIGLEMFTGIYASGGGSGLAIALMPLFLLAIERLLEPGRRADGRSGRWYAGWAGVAGLAATWIHPWQGITLLAILAGLVAWGRFERRYLQLALPAALTAAPLAYYFALSHTHSSFMTVAQPNDYSHWGWWLAASLLPAALALPGYLGQARDLGERMLRIWPIAAFLIYLAMNSTWFYHDFDGLSLPLAILAVRGWRRLRLPAVLAAAAIAIVIVPGSVWYVQQLIKTRPNSFFTADEARALAFLDRSPRRGAVLAPVFPLGQAVPAFSGRQTLVGHYYWTPDYAARQALTEALFDGRLPRAQALALVRASTARFLAADCKPGRADLTPLLGRIIIGVLHFGCATVYEVHAA